jgi:hypothetical protein
MVRMMLHGFAMLFGHEKHALLEALCRDMRSEERRTANNLQDAEYHLAGSPASFKFSEAPYVGINVARFYSYIRIVGGACEAR